MRKTAAAVLAVVALGSAAYFGSLNLNGHGHLACVHYSNGTCAGLLSRYWVADRAVWQFPVAVVIAALGPVGAVGVLKRT